VKRRGGLRFVIIFVKRSFLAEAYNAPRHTKAAHAILVVVYTHTHVLLDDIGDGDEVVLDYAVWVECRERYV
jgi:hypothetical protein